MKPMRIDFLTALVALVLAVPLAAEAHDSHGHALIGIGSTPAFSVGGRLVGGAVDAACMKQLAAAARADRDRG